MFQRFMLGLTLVMVQGALAGLFAYWIASRIKRAARVVGGIVVIALGWVSVVEILNRIAGEQASPLYTNLTIIAALFIGWLSGRNNRLRGGKERLFLDPQLRVVGAGIMGMSYIYSVAIGLLAIAMAFAIVNDAVGFMGVLVGLFLTPLTLAIVPLYAGLGQQNWLPSIITYGGSLTFYLGFTFGNIVTEVQESTHSRQIEQAGPDEAAEPAVVSRPVQIPPPSQARFPVSPSGVPTSAGRTEPSGSGEAAGVGGWLALVCFGLLVIGPLFLIVNLYSLRELQPLYSTTPGLAAFAAIEAVLGTALVTLGVVAAVQLVRLRPQGVTLAVWYFGLVFAYAVVAAALPYLLGLPGEWQSEFAKSIPADVARAGISSAIWLSYFRQSKRVRATYGRVLDRPKDVRMTPEERKAAADHFRATGQRPSIGSEETVAVSHDFDRR